MTKETNCRVVFGILSDKKTNFRMEKFENQAFD